MIAIVPYSQPDGNYCDQTDEQSAFALLFEGGPEDFVGGAFEGAGGLKLTGLALWTGVEWRNLGNVGGGFLTFPIFVYVLGVSSFTTRQKVSI